MRRTCRRCEGTGTIHICDGPHGTLECFDERAQEVPCEDCGGSGTRDRDEAGKGWTR